MLIRSLAAGKSKDTIAGPTFYLPFIIVYFFMEMAFVIFTIVVVIYKLGTAQCPLR